jgi:hypothetical protein
MAGSGSINDVLHQCGFVPDNEDDNAEVDSDGDGGPNTQPTPTNAPPPPTKGSPTLSTKSIDAGACGATKRQRTLTSDVWQYLDMLSKDVKGKPVRYGAHHKFYKKELSGKSTSGTGHLFRNVKSCLCKRQAATLCHLVARLDLPLGFGASPKFEEYIRIAHNPKFERVFMTTTTSDVDAYFVTKVDEVKYLLSDASYFYFFLTSDI